MLHAQTNFYTRWYAIENNSSANIFYGFYKFTIVLQFVFCCHQCSR